MIRSHSTQVIPKLSEYFGSDYPIPTLEAGWHEMTNTWEYAVPSKRRVSRSWLRKIHEWGYTRVMIARDGRHAEFSVKELLNG